MKVGVYFARAVACWFLLLTGLVCALLAAWVSLLPALPGDPPSPWALCAPLFLLACYLTWLRAERRGELLATDASGTSKWAVVLPVFAVGLGLQLLFAIPPGHMPRTSASGDLVQRSIDGDLFLALREGGVVLQRDAAVRVIAAGRPAAFKSAPWNPRRYRRQAFFTKAPRLVPGDPFDPWLLRAAYAVTVLAASSLSMGSRRSRAWLYGVAVLLVPLAVL